MSSVIEKRFTISYDSSVVKVITLLECEMFVQKRHYYHSHIHVAYSSVMQCRLLNTVMQCTAKASVAVQKWCSGVVVQSFMRIRILRKHLEIHVIAFCFNQMHCGCGKVATSNVSIVPRSGIWDPFRDIIKLGDQTHWIDRVRNFLAETFNIYVNSTSIGARYNESEIKSKFFFT